MLFGVILKELRRQKRYSVKELAEKAGIARQAITGFERHGREPKYTTIQAIANVLDVDAGIFFSKQGKLPLVLKKQGATNG